MSLWRRKKTPPADPDREWREEIAPRVKAAKEERARLLVGQESRVVNLEEVLFQHDPIGINFGENVDEYRPEAETITLRLPEASTMDDLLRIVHEEFVRWFGQSVAGPISRYEDITAEIWAMQTPPSR